jgi:hypothetical protein
MLVAIAIVCAAQALDCERDAVTRAVVGQGITPIACLIDGEAGAAANAALAPSDGLRIVIACRRRIAPD